MRLLLTALIAYSVSLVILLASFYAYEHRKAGPVAPRVLRIMTQLAALFALAPAAIYVLVRGLLSKHR